MLLSLPFLLIYFALSALLVRTDIRTGLLPDKFLCPLLWTGLLYQLCLHPDFCRARWWVRWQDTPDSPLSIGDIGSSADVKVWDMAT